MSSSDQDWPRCACGCGEPVPVRKASNPSKGWKIGDPCKYVAGHSSRARRKLPRNGRVACSSCGEVKAVGEFHRDKTRPSGLYPACKACQSEKARDWYQRPGNAERVAESAQRFTEANPGYRTAVVLRYQKTGKGRAVTRKHASAYRARKRNQFVEHVDPLVVFERDAGICGICDLPITGGFDVDHIVPLVKGGEHSYANVQAAHPSCNYSKKDRYSYGKT